MSEQQAAVQVRPIEPGDQQQWLQLWLGYQEFYEVNLDEQTSLSTFRRFFDPQEPVYSAVAVQNGELIGFVNSVLHRSTWTTGDYCYLEDLYVAPQVRGTGAGKLLIEWVQDFARQQRCARLYWHTHESNKRAQKLYDWVAAKSGFIEYQMPL
ncbi:GNAT family N-acetyltransferase [Pseudomonas sp. NFXW11]|uniref:GNAT family N-acetyltransferase n=1 Tax=Pseudomonas sp. NFXW11 TaxID=2819531 RepID=UPI003CEA9432